MKSYLALLFIVVFSGVFAAEGTTSPVGEPVTDAELVDAKHNIPSTELPDWVSDPTQGGAFKGMFAVGAKVGGREKEQRNMVMAVARKKFKIAYPNDDASRLIQRARYVDSSSGLMFIWMVLPSGQ